MLATDDTRSASRLELFFDLAYVLAIAQLASRLGSDMSWSAAAAFAGLFTVVWWSWVTPTVYANRFANNDLLYRLTKLAIMGAVVVMAGSAATATTTDTNLFAGGYLATQALLVGLYVRAWRHVQVARPTMTIYIACTVAGIGAWAASLPIGGSGKYALWAVGIAVEALAPVLASRYGSNVPVHVEHLPERFGLLVMLVLGESIAAVATGLHEAHWQIPSLLPAGCGFVLAAAAWWLYFDLGEETAGGHLQDRRNPQSTGTVDRYIYGHLPLTLGLAMLGVGIEQLVLHPGAGLSPMGRWAVTVGLATFLLGLMFVLAGTAHSWRAVWPWPAAALPCVLVIGVVSQRSPVTAAVLQTSAACLVVIAGLYKRSRSGQPTDRTQRTKSGAIPMDLPTLGELGEWSRSSNPRLRPAPFVPARGPQVRGPVGVVQPSKRPR